VIRMQSFSVLLAVAVIFGATATLAQSRDRATLESEIRATLMELKEAEQQFLAPSAKDLRKNAAFLSQPDTGLIRLLPRETFQDKLTISGWGAYYSFARLTHEYGFGSDIELQQRQFSVGFAGADFGFMARLGKKSLDGVTLDDPAAQFLASFAAPTVEAEAREQYRRSGVGFEVNGFSYNSRQALKAKNTYLLRSISYGRSDLLVAFRVIREDLDGSAVILWKILKRFPVPELARP
jgi:hypothetical protein